MEIITIKPEQLDAFSPLLPEEIARQIETQPAVLAFGAVIGNVPAGILVFSLEERQVRLLWLCTAQGLQGQGIARRLVRALLNRASRDQQAFRLVADVPRTERLHPAYLLLLTEGWMPVPFSLTSYSFTVGEALAQPFWQQEMNLDGVVPIRELPLSILREYSDRLAEHSEKGEAIPLPLNPQDYEPNLSLGYVSHGKLEAVLLFQREGEELILRYGQANIPMGFPKLLYSAGKRAMAQESPETRISLAAIGPVGRKITEKLLPGCGTQPMYRMILRLTLEQEEVYHV
ncbi:MAG: GNAT family N-acetyltransferase [Anaerotignum sp.]